MSNGLGWAVRSGRSSVIIFFLSFCLVFLFPSSSLTLSAFVFCVVLAGMLFYCYGGWVACLVWFSFTCAEDGAWMVYMMWLILQFIGIRFHSISSGLYSI